ncbi:MAG: hypothetical protein ACRD2A_11840 [Vicinamibacterales bacterium]
MIRGRKTSEFLLTLATIVAATVLLTLDKIPPGWWAAVAGLPVSVYTVARIALKAKTEEPYPPPPQDDPEV